MNAGLIDGVVLMLFEVALMEIGGAFYHVHYELHSDGPDIPIYVT